MTASTSRWRSPRMPHRVALLVGAALAVVGVAVMVVVAITATVMPLAGASPDGSGASAPAPSASFEAVAPEPTVVGEAANGQTLSLRAGQILRVVLGSPSAAGSTSWTFAPLPSGVLAPLGDPTITPDRSAAGCARPGTGCGTVALVLAARTAGVVDVSASRQACGEALRCAPEQSQFHLTVVVRS
jgi:hypothetical protein